MILIQHQMGGAVDVLVVESHGSLQRQLLLAVGTQLLLNERHYSVVHHGYKLGLHAIAHTAFTALFNAADAVGLDENLVGERRKPQHAP